MTRTTTTRRTVALLVVLFFAGAAAVGGAVARDRDLLRAVGAAWHGARLVEVGGVLQRRDNDCGPAALAHALRKLGHDVPFPDPRSPLPLGPSGCRMDDLAAESRRLGRHARMLRIARRDLPATSPPAILYLPRRRHFVVWEGRGPRGDAVHDPAYGRVIYAPGRLERRWEGMAVVFGAPCPTLVDDGRGDRITQRVSR